VQRRSAQRTDRDLLPKPGGRDMLERVGARALDADGREDGDRKLLEPPDGESERLGCRAVEPLRIVDRDGMGAPRASSRNNATAGRPGDGECVQAAARRVEEGADPCQLIGTSDLLVALAFPA
jgi:hypothetical protein